MNRILLAALMLVFCAGSVVADETSEIDCGANVKVCFADGDDTSCICKEREITLEDTVPNVSSCFDPDDDGGCDE